MPDFDLAKYADLYPFQSHYLDIDGHKLHYLDEGKGPVILMLHGNPTWSFYYRNLVLSLRGKYRCIVPDHMGCGLSDKPQDYTYRLNRHIENLLRLVHHLDLRDIGLVVHDWGGMIGFGTAMADASRFKRFFLLNTGAFRLPKTANLSKRIAFCRVPGLGKMAVRVFNAFARGAAMMATVSKAMTQKEKDGLCAPYNSFANRIATLRFVEDIPLETNHPSYARLQQIEEGLGRFSHLPRKIVWGAQDFCFDDEFLARWKEVWPDVDVTYIKEAGHYVLEDARTTVIQEALDFFAKSDKHEPAS